MRTSPASHWTRLRLNLLVPILALTPPGSGQDSADWQRVRSGPWPICALAVSDCMPSVTLAGDGFDIHRSSDGGETWTAANGVLFGGDGIAVDPVNPNILFRGTRAPPCLAACDANGQGGLQAVTDAIYLLRYVFLGGPPPAPPFPQCGVGALETDEAVDCDQAAETCR